MSFNDRISAAQAVISEHNDAIGGKDKPGFVDSDQFISCIKATGGTTEERLSQLSHEDILECLPNIPTPTGSVKPRILAKAIAGVFRKDAKADPTLVDEKRPVSAKKAERMTPRELVESFDPEDFNNTVGARLHTMSRNEPFIVFVSGRLVDVDTTVKLLMEVKQGYKGRSDVEVNGNVKKVYRLGQLPENYADENPLYRGRPLRPDGTCDQTGRSWEGISLEVRQFVRVAIEIGQLTVSHEKAHDIIDIVMEPDALNKLRSRYRQAAIQFDEWQKTGNLPNLKIELATGGSESTSPFAEGKRVEWMHVHGRVSGGTYTSNIARRP